MKQFKLEQVNIEVDKPQIANWDNLFKSHKNYASIKKFILEDDLIFGLGEMIDANYERFPIGEDETKNMLVAKTQENEILGFIILDAFDLNTPNSQLFIQYIVISPKYQHSGYGNEILTELFSNFKKYIKVKPKNIFCYVHNENLASKKLFSKFGFNFVAMKNSNYECGQTLNKNLQAFLSSQKEKF